MPLTEHFQNCFCHGTSWKEAGNRVNVAPSNGEIVKFFVIDPESNPKCSFRDITKLMGPICDLIVTYNNIRNQVQIICLIELKGNKLKHAIAQILNTQQALKKHHEIFRSANYRCFILIGGSAPIIRDETDINNLNRNFGRGNFKITRKQNKDELGKFLRVVSV